MDDKAEKAGARTSRADREKLKEIRDMVSRINSLVSQLGLEDEPEPEPEMEAPQMDTDDRSPMGDAAAMGENSIGGKQVELPEANTLKAILSTDDTLRVANHIVLWGGRDLEGIANKRENKDGSKGEFFTKSTDFSSDYTDVLGRFPVDWEHRKQPEGLGPKADMLGYVDWSTAKSTDFGIWVERILNRHNAYIQWLEPLIEAGIVGTSSEADSTKVEKGTNGEIKRWPFIADALTVTPMEARMKTENVVAALKTAADKDTDLFNAACGSWKGIICKNDDNEVDSTETENQLSSELEQDQLLLKLNLLELELS